VPVHPIGTPQRRKPPPQPAQPAAVSLGPDTGKKIGSRWESVQQEEWSERLRQEIQEAGGRKKANLRVASQLYGVGLDRDASKLLGCGGWLMYRQWLETGSLRLRSADFCNQRLACLPCSRASSLRNVRKLHGKLAEYLTEHDRIPILMTLSGGQDVPSLADGVMRLWAALRRASERRRNAGKGLRVRSEFAKIAGGAFFMEVKRGRDSGLWHPHVHALVMLPRGVKFDLGQLWPEWDRLRGYVSRSGQAGEGCNVRVTNAGRELLRARKPFPQLSAERRELLIGDLLEVSKYALKFNEMSAADVVRVHRLLKGSHLRRSWGDLRNLPDEDAGGDLTDEDGPYLDHLFRWLDGSYRLERTTGSAGFTAAEPESIDPGDCPF
jgi:hypothetical protein